MNVMTDRFFLSSDVMSIHNPLDYSGRYVSLLYVSLTSICMPLSSSIFALSPRFEWLRLLVVSWVFRPDAYFLERF